MSGLMDLMGPGFGGALGVVRGMTPTAQRYVDYTRKVWPSLLAKLDALDDIGVRFLNRYDPRYMARYSGGEYTPKNLVSKYPGGVIDVADTIPGVGFTAQTNVRNLLHEYLHALYAVTRKDGTSILGTRSGVVPHYAVPPLRSPEAESVMQNAIRRGNYSPTRYNQFREMGTSVDDKIDALQHGALDAMSNNIYRAKIQNPARLLVGSY